MRQPPQRGEHRVPEDGPHHHALHQFLHVRVAPHVRQVGVGDPLAGVGVVVEHLHERARPTELTR
ncbi:hypothetical protein [Streptomyces sp. A1-5]|uniref:hypothetical protein n=1 Tax=Streptomyces sp. A1-5 TaxID=2738410 RepID=UPI003FA7B0C0|nr:hypothetical protein HRD51_10275 [Streptomyces sp. A1-5]